MVPLYPKAVDVLVFLVERHGAVATKEELLERVWPQTFVEEGTLTRSISVLRKALGDTPEGHAYILTVPKRGYRFVAPIREETAEAPTNSPSAAMPPLSAAKTSETISPNQTGRRAILAGIVLAILLGAAGLLYWSKLRGNAVIPARIRIAVLPVQNLTGDPDR
jgi:DNA-binding winged helix-turn-helix (wHTH) protein